MLFPIWPFVLSCRGLDVGFRFSGWHEGTGGRRQRDVLSIFWITDTVLCLLLPEFGFEYRLSLGGGGRHLHFRIDMKGVGMVGSLNLAFFVDLLEESLSQYMVYTWLDSFDSSFDKCADRI